MGGISSSGGEFGERKKNEKQIEDRKEREKEKKEKRGGMRINGETKRDRRKLARSSSGLPVFQWPKS